MSFEEKLLPSNDPSTRAELLHLSPSFLVPCLEHDEARVWGTLAIAEYLEEVIPGAGLLPHDRKMRAHCRSISDEMHQGFNNLRSALPMNLKAHYPNFKLWQGVRADIDRIVMIWSDCLRRYGGPFLMGSKQSLADAMFAPVVTRFATYDVRLDDALEDYGRRIMELPDMLEWAEAAKAESDDVEELEAEF